MSLKIWHCKLKILQNTPYTIRQLSKAFKKIPNCKFRRIWSHGGGDVGGQKLITIAQAGTLVF